MNRKWKIIFLIGFLLCCFPIIHSIVSQRRQQDAVATYQKAVMEEENSKLKEMWKNAEQYNEMLYQTEGAVVDHSDMTMLSDKSYQSQLNLSQTGIMGSLDIPKINVELPIYHGTEDEVLSDGIGHLQGTSLPVGGANTHCALTGHRGLPSAKLLVRLDEMKMGDLFFIRIGKETLSYKVDEVQTVTPEEVSKLEIQPEKDLVSLITCTPYGINSHRLIVTGRRVAYEKFIHEEIQKAIPSFREIAITALPFVLLLIAIGFYLHDRRHQDYENEKI